MHRIRTPLVLRGAGVVVALAAIAGTALVGGLGPMPIKPTEPAAPGPSEIQIEAIIRDFLGAGQTGGHADFEAYSSGSVRVGLVKPTLDSDAKPTIASLSGRSVGRECRDAKGRAIPLDLCDRSRGDAKGESTPKTDRIIASEPGFSQWFRDVPGVNKRQGVTLTLARQSEGGTYVFDSSADPAYRGRGGFFPIDGQLMGDTPGWNHNFSFTTEIDADFDYQRGKGHLFVLACDDDAWVFIDGRLVLDLGGVHPRRELWLELDRLAWLEDNAVHRLQIFHAERRTSQSSLRLETTLELRAVQTPERIPTAK
jgi:fibro-slime domain-containing protein